jgi:hypothetical protein
MNNVYLEDPDLFSPDVDYRLWTRFLNDVHSNLNQMTAFDAAKGNGAMGTGQTWQACQTVSNDNQMIWTGTSTTTWDAAKTACEASAPALSVVSGVSLIDKAACRYTAGWYLVEDGVTNWTAKMVVRMSHQVQRYLDTNLNKMVQFYVRGTAGGSDVGQYATKQAVWDSTAFDYGTASNTWYFVDVYGPYPPNSAATSEPMNVLTAPIDMWCDEPTGYYDSQKGWTASGQKAVLDFAVTGGMQYR